MRKAYIAACLLLCLSTLACSVNRISAASTEVAVDPSVSTVKVGDVFSVNVNVTNVVNLTAWQLNIYYLNAVINCTNAAEGPFLQTGGGTYFGQNITNNYNSTYGCVLAYSTLLGMTSVNGSGVILTVTFEALSGGNTALELANTELGNEQVPPQQIPHQDFGGTVIVTEANHDVTVTNVTSDKIFIGQGYCSNVTVTIENLGGYTETFNTTVYANQTIIDTPVNTTLTSGSFTTITFTWNTTGFDYGNYTISVYAWLVPGETDTGNNNLTGGAVTVTIPGDVDGNGRVDMNDVVLILRAFGSTTGMPNYDANCDITGNGQVDMGDVVIALSDFGQHYP